ncbi:MAG TPA: DegT/DnrJ/EryC1/StrS family aminotransferase [Spirochaetota bacterium]|nr:DegT/DnrJ/EryC1/StrS family aminotransferase [Spirochaetota bacterium]
MYKVVKQKFRNIPFYKHDISRTETRAVKRVLNSGWINTGPETQKFENDLKEFTGSDHVIALNSATAGLFLSLKIFGVKPGDEVITTPVTYAATANVIFHTGARPVFADIGTDWNIDYKKVAPLITERTKAVISVDLGGVPCDYDELYEVLHSQKKLFKPSGDLQQKLGRPLLLADCAHSFGALYKKRSVARAADIAVFSFHVVKNITTADGGALCFDDAKISEGDNLENELRVLALHGQTKSAFRKMKSNNWRYDITAPGYKFNMTDIAAALGRVQLKRNRAFYKKRRAITDVYDNAFKDSTGVTRRSYDKTARQSAFHLYILQLEESSAAKRDRLLARMAARGISCNVHFIPLPHFSFYKNAGYNLQNYPLATQYYHSALSLPMYYRLAASDQQYIIRSFQEAEQEL